MNFKLIVVGFLLSGCTSVKPNIIVPNELELEGSTLFNRGYTDSDTTHNNSYGLLLRGRWKLKD
jgi:hypothetical protein